MCHEKFNNLMIILCEIAHEGINQKIIELFNQKAIEKS